MTVTGTYPNRMTVDVSATVASVEKVLHVTMNLYQHPMEARRFYAPDRDPSLNLAVPILRISGLDNYSRPHPHSIATRIENGGTIIPQSGSGPGGTYWGTDFRAAYVPSVSLDGSGQKLGLLQFDGFNPNDITYYENYKIPHLPNVTLDTVLLDNFNGLPIGNDNYDREVCLDIDMAISMAPGLSAVVIYEAGPNGNYDDIITRMATDDICKQLSSSWGIGGEFTDSYADQVFQEMATQGQTFFNASGDIDAITHSTWISGGDTVHSYFDFPSEDSNIIQVGGTTLTTSGPAGSWSSETVWNTNTYYGYPTNAFVGSTGGVGTLYSIPNWQQNANSSNNQVSSSYRNVPDVALTADNIYVRCSLLDGSDWTVMGTSAAAPLWAGFVAMVNQEEAAIGKTGVGFIDPAIYKIAELGEYNSDFHDVTSGNNEWSGSGGDFTASTGYDLCTGWGTPNGQNLISDLTLNLYVPGQYSTIASALSAAVSGQTVIVSGAQTVSSNLTVPSGVTLQINPGATITFSGYYKLRIEGALYASGSSSSPITFQGSGSPGSWFGIEFYDISQGSSLRYCTIKDATYGLNLISSYLPPNPLVITNNDYGVNCTNYSDPSFISTVFSGNNYDVYGDATSTMLLGTSTGPGYNSFRNPGIYQVYSTYSGTISAEGNWWGSSSPSPYVTSNVDYSNWLSSDPNPEMKEVDGKHVVVVQSVSSSSSEPQISQPKIASSDTSITKLDAAYRLYLGGDYKDALQAFETVTTSYPNDFAACRALVFTERCLDKLGESSGVLTELNDVSAARTGTKVGTFAEARRTYQYLERGKYQEALAQAVQIAGSSSDTALVKFALYDAGSIDWYDLGNKRDGEKYYRQLISHFPGDPLSASALVAMGESTSPSASQQQADTSTVEKRVALGNYPNPFNPTTEISYQLPRNGQVTLKVYDVLGRLVSTLVEGYQSAGVHTVQFNGDNLASGVYFYQLTAPGLEKVNKMILMK